MYHIYIYIYRYIDKTSIKHHKNIASYVSHHKKKISTKKQITLIFPRPPVSPQVSPASAPPGCPGCPAPAPGPARSRPRPRKRGTSCGGRPTRDAWRGAGGKDGFFWGIWIICWKHYGSIMEIWWK